jgi:leader peptidase (prepilin peptidase)/N-methyltransferase
VSLLVAAGCAAAAGVAGACVPAVVRRLPEPPPPRAQEPDGDRDEADAPPPKPRREVPDFSLWGMHARERDKEPYRDLAAVRHLALGCALASALVAGLLGWRFGWHPVLAIVIPPVPVCVAIAVVDWRTRYIPSWLVLPATAYVVLAGLVLWAAFGDRTDFVRGLVGLVVVRSVLWVAWFVYSAGMGFGDVRLGALTGFVLGYLGPGELFVGTWLGFVSMAVPVLVLALLRWNRQLLRVAFPFGPFLLVGALIGIFLGQPVIDAVYG